MNQHVGPCGYMKAVHRLTMIQQTRTNAKESTSHQLDIYHTFQVGRKMVVYQFTCPFTSHFTEPAPGLFHPTRLHHTPFEPHTSCRHHAGAARLHGRGAPGDRRSGRTELGAPGRGEDFGGGALRAWMPEGGRSRRKEEGGRRMKDGEPGG